MMTTVEDAQFRKRIQSALETVQRWQDPKLLTAIRDQLSVDDAQLLSATTSELEYFQQLVQHFQQHTMTWVNQPPCCKGATVSLLETRGPVTEQERTGQARRVEVYQCQACHNQVCLPRFNCPLTLLQTRRGRCGEFANLFGAYCRATGIATRYCLDVTDHVWIEVLIDNVWHMLDPCEGALDAFSMYEKGWGKKLSVIVGVSTTHVVDITPKYTRHFHDPDFQARRRQITSSEASSAAILDAINAHLQQSMTDKEVIKIQRQLQHETKELERLKQERTWDASSYNRGRISGSGAWKHSRNETGNGNSETNNAARIDSTSYPLPVLFPQSSGTLRVELYPETCRRSICVNGVSCAVGKHLSVVVLDQRGCILQSHSFGEPDEWMEFVSSLPQGNIVCMVGKLTAAPEHATELGGLDISKMNDGILYAGQVLYKPDWAVCLSYSEAKNGVRLAHQNIAPTQCRLRTVRHTRPTGVVGRLPESIMPLRTQQMASEEQKRIAFSKLKEPCFGYTTKPGSPIYLLGTNAYPLVPLEETEESWNTFLLLPKEMVPEDDNGITMASSAPNYEVPVDVSFFERSLGASLLTGNQNQAPTKEALRNARLVGFYFSAHWCGPCRSFTPMLSEMYQVLKDAYPSHGLEIVFVSSDRDATSFHQYFTSMPWLAMPFESASMFNQILSTTYGVRGIPSLVILDSVSGQVVVPNGETRKQVMVACSRGEAAIESMFEEWLGRVPMETRQLLKMLETSCQPEEDSRAAQALISQYFLVRPSYLDKQYRMKALISELVDDGLSHDEAETAAREVEALNDEEPGGKTELEVGPLPTFFEFALVHEPHHEYSESFLSEKVGTESLASVLRTASKYLRNCMEEPWNEKFRTIHLSYKVADSKITSVAHSLPLLVSFGFEIVGGLEDFSLRIPVHVDLEVLSARLNNLLPLVEVA